LPERYEVAVNTLLEEDYISGVIIIQTLQTMTDPVKDAMVAINAHKRFRTKPIICTYMGGKFSRKGNELLKAHNIPDYNDQRKAALAMAALIHRGKIAKPEPKECKKCASEEKRKNKKPKDKNQSSKR